MTNTAQITTEDAVELAHTYHWLMCDIAAGSDAGISIYGDRLLSMQERMGVQLINPISLKIIVRAADERFEAANAN